MLIGGFGVESNWLCATHHPATQPTFKAFAEQQLKKSRVLRAPHAKALPRNKLFHELRQELEYVGARDQPQPLYALYAWVLDSLLQTQGDAVAQGGCHSTRHLA